MAPLAEIIAKRGRIIEHRKILLFLVQYLSFVLVGDRDEAFSILHDSLKAAKRDAISGAAPSGAVAINAIVETLEKRPAI